MTSGGDRARFIRIVGSHLVRYPLMQPQDLYKLLHQSAMGSGHAIADEYDARDMFYRELERLPKGPPEPMVDIISAEGSMARINMRPYMAAGGDPDSLVAAFIRTSREYAGDPTILERYGHWIREMGTDGLFPVSLAGIEDYMTSMMLAGYPAVHHSETYSKSYFPSYRVILSGLTGTLSIFPGEALSPGPR